MAVRKVIQGKRQSSKGHANKWDAVVGSTDSACWGPTEGPVGVVKLSARAASQLRRAKGRRSGASAASTTYILCVCVCVLFVVKELDMTGMYPVLEVNPSIVYVRVLKKHIKRKESSL